MKDTIQKNMLTLGAFAFICTLLIAGTFQLTKKNIKHNEAQYQLNLLTRVVPSELYDNQLNQAIIAINPTTSLGLTEMSQGYLATYRKEPTAVILPVITQAGYSGPIHLLMGITTQGKITGVRVTYHRETPGLGDKIEAQKSDWINIFTGESLQKTPSNLWKVKKDGGQFDQLTGATITSRAVVEAIAKAQTYFLTHKDQLIRSVKYND